MSTSSLLTWFLVVVPVALVWLVGALVALATWKRHPGVSAVALCACLLLLFNAVAGSAVQYALFSRRVTAGWSAQQMAMWISLLNLCRTGVVVAGYGLLVWAVFGWRTWPGRAYAPEPVDASLRPPPREPPPELPPRDSDDIQKRPSWS